MGIRLGLAFAVLLFTSGAFTLEVVYAPGFYYYQTSFNERWNLSG